MTLGKMLLEQLKRLGADVARPEHGDQTVTVEGEGTRVSVLIADLDRYSVALHTLTLGSPVEVGEDARAFLSARAAAIAQQLSYLEEPLAVWELDAGERTAQLRSSPPQREGDELSYWEVVLHASDRAAATLTRYRWAPDMAEREMVSYPATFALVARLSDSLAAALDM